ncbi:hypothetical protein SAMN06265377_0090 [Flagellimonas pacifica]|uniref:Uncharacterized protein n=1 Tax=Flagellimonas pacifica TaxID=1247520 RepID=A0A285MB64_9FLAO|nr:hypothetical protein SAMN06265377_0082 [Allomuricauda parva]SNY94432.1 hypothetical protein SAMN06265377_0090 [Allomuricauda parva]
MAIECHAPIGFFRIFVAKKCLFIGLSSAFVANFQKKRFSSISLTLDFKGVVKHNIATACYPLAIHSLLIFVYTRTHLEVLIFGSFFSSDVSVGRADILHNLHYNDSFLSIKITTLKTVRSGLIMPIM